MIIYISSHIYIYIYICIFHFFCIYIVERHWKLQDKAVVVIKEVIDKLNGMDYIEGGAGGRSLNLKIFDVKGICMLIHRCMDALLFTHM